MTSISTKVIIAVTAGVIGLGAVAPAMAQSAPRAPDAAIARVADGAAGHALRPHDQGRRGGFGGLFDFARGGEGIEVALVRLSHRIDLTDEQQTLLDALKTSALAAAQDFATATDSLRPTPPAEGEARAIPSISERLENRISLEKAQLAALEAVQPAVAAFFDSLTDAQKAQLMPQRGEHDGGPRGGHQRGFGGQR